MRGKDVAVNQSDVPFLKQVTQAAPAVGADWRYTGPGQGIQRIVAMRGVLTTSAAVANRLVSLVLSDGTFDYATVPSPAAITASKSGVVSTVPGAPSVGAADGPLLYPSPTDGWLLLPGWSIRASTTAIDVGDQWSAVQLWVVEYPTGPFSRQTPDLAAIYEAP